MAISLPIISKFDDRGIKDAGRAIKGFESRLGGLEKLLRVGVAGAAVVAGAAIAGVGFAITKGFGRLQEIENAQFKLKGLGNSAEVVEEVMKNALAAVKGTAFGLGEAGTIAASAVAAGVKPGKELTRFLTLTADAAAIAGTSLEEMGGALNKVVTVGKAQNDTLRTLAEKGIPIYAALADQLGVTAEKIFSMATEGEISVEMLATALETTLGGAAKKMGDSTAGAFANMNAAIARSGANLIKDIFPQFGNFFRQMIEVMEPVEAIATRVGQALGDKLNPVFETLIESLPKIIPFLNSLTGVFVVLTNRFMIVKSVLEPIVQGFKDLLARLPELVAIFDSVRVEVERLARMGLNLLLTFGFQVANLLVPALIEAFIKLAPPIIELVSKLVDDFLPVIIEIATHAIPIFVGVLNIVTPILQGLANILAGTGSALVILSLAVFGAIKAFALFRTAIVILQGVQLGLAAATFGTVGATFAVTTAQKVGLVVGKLLTGQYLMQAGALLTNTVHLIAHNIAVGAQAVANSAAVIALKAFFTALVANTVQIVRQTGAMIINTAQLVAGRVALVATAVATNVAAAAVRLFNLALMANPIGIIIGLIALLVAGLVFFFTQTDLGRELFTKFVDGMKIAITGFGMVFATIINGILTRFESFVNFFVRGFNTILRGVNQVRRNLNQSEFALAAEVRFGRLDIPKLADGGIVQARPGGILANIGEGRFDEAVIPLDRKNRMGSTFNITVNAGVGTNGPQVGEQIVNLIRKYERTSGPVFARA